MKNRAFTLVELLVAIGIVVILMSMLIISWSAVQNISYKQKTEINIQKLEMIYTEWSQFHDGRIIEVDFKWGFTPPLYENKTWKAGDYDGSNSQKISWMMMPSQELYGILLSGMSNTSGQIVSDLTDHFEKEGFVKKIRVSNRTDRYTYADASWEAFVDAWGVPLDYCPWVTTDEGVHPVSNTYFFASSGRDMQWGDQTDPYNTRFRPEHDDRDPLKVDKDTYPFDGFGKGDQGDFKNRGRPWHEYKKGGGYWDKFNPTYAGDNIYSNRDK